MPPVYSCECPKCGRERDYYATVENRNKEVPKCCGKKMSRTVGACRGYVQKELAPYISPATGQTITSHAQRRDDFKRSRSRPWEGLEQENKEAARKRKYREDKFDAKLEENARRAWHQLDPKKRAELGGY